MKMISDLAFALIGVLVFLPLMLLIVVILILAEWRSPFFLQNRVGYRMREFTIIKFRTMIDGEVTPIGKFLRKTGIDELPQLFNILLLNMSFVGPRPLTVYDIERLGWDDDFYKIRWQVRPGLVGPAQLSNICHAKVSWLFDKYYIQKQSFWLDLKIICSSVAVLFLGKEKVRQWVQSKMS